jgi:FG-GAP-like repeat
MRILFTVTIAILAASPAVAADFPKFKAQEIDSGLKIGYAVIVVDIDGDKKPDIVVVDQHQIVWYQNPGKPGMDWKKRIILDGKTKPDNVCIAAIDIDGDGLPELVIGSAWKPFDTGTAAQLGWVKRGKTIDEEWTYYPLPCDEPTVHRVRVADIDGDGKPSIILAPLMGRDSTAKGNWMDGRPVRIVAFKPPAKNPEKPENWKQTVLSEELHVVHNIWPYTPPGAKRPMSILAASYEGYAAIMLEPHDKPPQTKVVNPGNQVNPKSNRGASEIKNGYYQKPDPNSKDRAAGAFVATIEPWHGNEVVVYASKPLSREPERFMLDDHLRWGHAVWCADLDGDGVDELIVGVRDDPNPKMGDKFTERRGVRIYKNTDGKGQKWERFILEDGGVAVEDLTVADLDGDGKIDIIAVGRATGNCRIYWNQGK